MHLLVLRTLTPTLDNRTQISHRQLTREFSSTTANKIVARRYQPKIAATKNAPLSRHASP